MEGLETGLKKKKTKELEADMATALKCKAMMENNEAIRNGTWNPIETAFINT